MIKKRKSELVMMGCIVIVAIFLIKANVVAYKEEGSDGQSLTLEITSETVKNIYDKLTILEDDLKSDNYKYPYFNMKGSSSKSLSLEEKFYIAVENLYHEKKLDIEKTKDIEKIKVGEQVIIDEIQRIFKIDFNPKDLNYLTAVNCGIVDYLYTGESYELSIKACGNSKEIERAKLLSASKEGNLIKLRVKSLYARVVKPKKKGEDEKYELKNYSSDETLGTVTIDELQDERLFEKYDIEEYVISFELDGDEYMLKDISKN